MKLSDMQCRSAKPRDKPFKLSDGEGLYLEIMPGGSKHWRLKFRINGKEKRISFGKFPQTSLHQARQKRGEAKEHLRKGFDPVLISLEKQQTASLAQANTFEQMAMEWHSKQLALWKPQYAGVVRHRLEKYIFPDIGNYPVTMIKPMVMLGCLQKIERTAPELSRRMKALCSHVFKYAIATGRAEVDPTYGLEAAMKKFKKGHYASISVDEFPTFLLTLNEYRDRISRQTFLALKLLLLTFVRTGELVEAKWSEIDFSKAMWTIPGERMKMNLPHMVPLSRQSLTILQELKEMNGKRDYILPGHSQPRFPMCKNTMLVAIKRMGYNGRMTGHGFRSLALGILKEKLNYSHDVSDRQLAHVPKSSVDRAYDRAQFLPQRIEMMQRYADYIDNTYLQTLSERMLSI